MYSYRTVWAQGRFDVDTEEFLVNCTFDAVAEVEQLAEVLIDDAAWYCDWGIGGVVGGTAFREENTSCIGLF